MARGRVGRGRHPAAAVVIRKLVVSRAVGRRHLDGAVIIIVTGDVRGGRSEGGQSVYRNSHLLGNWSSSSTLNPVNRIRGRGRYGVCSRHLSCYVVSSRALDIIPIVVRTSPAEGWGSDGSPCSDGVKINRVARTNRDGTHIRKRDGRRVHRNSYLGAARCGTGDTVHHIRGQGRHLVGSSRGRVNRLACSSTKFMIPCVGHIASISRGGSGEGCAFATITNRSGTDKGRVAGHRGVHVKGEFCGFGVRTVSHRGRGFHMIGGGSLRSDALARAGAKVMIPRIRHRACLA